MERDREGEEKRKERDKWGGERAGNRERGQRSSEREGQTERRKMEGVREARGEIERGREK